MAIRKISYESHLPLPIGSICMPYMVTKMGYIDGIHGAPYMAYMDPMGC